MKPTTTLGALLDILHRSRYEDHPIGCECEYVSLDRPEAIDLEAKLSELGAHVAFDVALPKSAPKGREGSLDLTEFTEQVLYVVVAHGPLPTNDLNSRYQGYSEQLPSLFPKRSWDTPRKRLSELEDAGFVRQVLKPDGKQLTWNGYGVWEATEKGRVRCPSYRWAA